MTGKERCAYLKGLRKKIADDNGIDYNPTECTFKGECKGTCPKCESEMAMLSKKVATVGLVAVMTGALVGCTPDKGGSDIQGGMTYEPAPSSEATPETSTTEVDVTSVIEESTGGELSGQFEVATVEETTVPETTKEVRFEGDLMPAEVPEDTQLEPLAGVLPAPDYNGGN